MPKSIISLCYLYFGLTNLVLPSRHVLILTSVGSHPFAPIIFQSLTNSRFDMDF
jgi:hypothetical protein